MNLQIEQIDVEKLIPYVNNARTHSNQQIDQIAASIKEFGFINPVIVDKEHGIIAGHGRVLAAKKLGLNQVPTIKAEHLTELQKKAYILADNKLAELAGWDNDLLKIELQALHELDFDINIAGFDSDEFLLNLQNESKKDIDDQIPQKPEPICKPDDIWQLGDHRIMCGDSTYKENVEKLLNGENVDMVFTDPPYGIGYEYNLYKDEKDRTKHLFFLRNLINLSLNIADRFILTPGRNNLDVVAIEPKPNHVGCWTKTNAMTSGTVTHFMAWEPILFYGKWKRKRANDVFNFPIGRQPDTADHACPKPIALWQDIIENFSEPKEAILDLFIGSGSTIIACQKINRKCFGMEIDPHYCDVIINRWQNYTDQKAIKIN